MRPINIAIGMVVTLATMTLAADEPTTRPATKSIDAGKMLGQMLSTPAEGETRALQPVNTAQPDSTSGSGAVAPGAPQLAVMREGSFVVDRTGRLSASGDGQRMEFTFEADGRTLQDPPVVIVPNLNLMKMEDAVQAMRRDLKFRITGVVSEYRGRNYVTVDKVVVVPEVLQQF